MKCMYYFHKWNYYGNYGNGSVFRVCRRCKLTQRWGENYKWEDWKKDGKMVL